MIDSSRPIIDEVQDEESTSVEAETRDDELNDLELVTAQRDEYLEQLQRSMADFANFRRRSELERSQMRTLAAKDLLLQLLPLADDMHRGLRAVPEEERESPWVQGFQLIERKLDQVLERHGVEELDALGSDFDPSVHEAVAVDPGSSENKVVEVYQTGYQQGGQLLRPAMVRVGDLPQA